MNRKFLAGLALILSSALHGAESDWIVGGWAQKGDYCASGAPLVFKRSGEYTNSGGDFTGTWSLAGQTLSLMSRSVSIDVDRSGKPVETLGPVKRETATIRRVALDRMILGGRAFRRCPINGGAEPWHPAERFSTR